MAANPPIHTIRMNGLAASIWLNTTQHGEIVHRHLPTKLPARRSVAKLRQFQPPRPAATRQARGPGTQLDLCVASRRVGILG